jgi:hypothetical protein
MPCTCPGLKWWWRRRRRESGRAGERASESERGRRVQYNSKCNHAHSPTATKKTPRGHEWRHTVGLLLLRTKPPIHCCVLKRGDHHNQSCAVALSCITSGSEANVEKGLNLPPKSATTASGAWTRSKNWKSVSRSSIPTLEG